ncbi:MAG: protein kinase [Bdellovibrionales bacterium]|nr:protein kinase [Bdellovibrionales bacterium]
MAAPCSTCSEPLIPGSLFCDACGSSQNHIKVARKLRQASFSKIKDAGKGLLAPGERIKARGQRYVVEEAIARSGFGATFRALREKDGKQVLIKQMLEQSSYDQFKAQLMQSFKREAKFLRRIKHPAFPRGFQYFQRHGSFYLVMEFINGKELAKALSDFRNSNPKVEDGMLVYLGIEIADALQVIHDAGYIYRDLKPQNVMLDGISGRIKMIDFGTLYHRSDKDPLVFESEGYTPPDLLDATNPFMPSGDIYSLGALLFEAAVGDTPSQGEPIARHLKGRDPRLVAIIEKCLNLDPTKRFQKAKEVRNELAKLTNKGWWIFKRRDFIEPIELAVLPKTLFPAACTFCDYCGHSDNQSQAGYCVNCRIPLKVGRVQWAEDKKDKGKEFFLYADETLIGKSSEAHVSLGNVKGSSHLGDKHARIAKRGNALWLEALPGHENDTWINKRRICGPVELLEGDVVHLGKARIALTFSLRDAC